VYLGSHAEAPGPVDELGTRADVIDRLEATLGERIAVRDFAPARPLAERIRGGAQSAAFALGAGVASTVAGDVDGLSVET
jgi:protease-4